MASITLDKGSRFELPDGDGNQEYFSAPIYLLLTDAEWFPGCVPDYGEALLFVVDEGKHAGEYLVLSGRGGDFIRILQENGYAGVVVFKVENATASYDKKGRRDLEGIGRSVIYKR